MKKYKVGYVSFHFYSKSREKKKEQKKLFIFGYFGGFLLR